MNEPSPRALAAGVGLAVAGALLLLAPRRLPPEAVVDKRGAFAVEAPRDWLTLGPEHLRVLGERQGGTVPPALSGFLEKAPSRLSFLRVVSQREFAPSISVAVVSGDGPAADPVESLRSTLGPGLAAAEAQPAAAVEVDGLRGARVDGRFALRSGGARAGFRFSQVSVAGGKRSYLLTCLGPEEEFDLVRALFEKTLVTFRVLDRPLVPLRWALAGGLLGLAAFFLAALVRRAAA